jgi:hypothetical protein
MLPRPGARRHAANDRRFARARRKRAPLVALAGAIAREPVELAIPVHRRDPARLTVAGAAEIGAFVMVLLTGSVLALVVLVVALVAFVGLTLADRRAVVALGTDRRGALLDGGRTGRPTRILGPAEVREIPSEPTGLSTPLTVNGERWWVDRSAYPSLRRPQ